MRQPAHPGALLREDLIAELGTTAGELSRVLRIPEFALARVVQEEEGVSPLMARALEAAGFGTARAWLAMQAAHERLDEGRLNS